MSADILSIVPTPHYCELPVDVIHVDGRHRTDLGDIKSLADSIDDIGLIHNIVVTPDHHLVAGERRLAAVKSLGWDTVPVFVIQTLADATDRLLAERDENTCRKDFTASELVSLGRQLEELERPKAQERQGSRNDLTSGSVEPEVLYAKTDKVVGEALGVSQSTYKRAKTVVAATADPDPEIAEVARDQLAKLDAGETSYSAASRAVREARSGKEETQPDNAEPEVIPGLPAKPKGGPRPNHLKILTNITNTLAGFVMVLDDIEEINNTVTTEEARRIRSDLSKQIRALNRINNLLKGV